MAPGTWSARRWLALCVFSLLICSLEAGAKYGRRKRHRITAKEEAFLKAPPESDYLTTLSDAERRQWTFDNKQSINASINVLLALHVHIVVDVKIVGFYDKADMNYPLLLEKDLRPYLDALQSEMETVALEPSPKHLVVKPVIKYNVYRMPEEYAAEILSALKNAAVDLGVPVRFIPYNVVDDLIRRDYESFPSRHTIYLISLPPSPPPQVWQHVYTYTTERGSCPGGLWVGRQPYAWVDLSAYPSFYGPGPGGKGQVFRHTVPVLEHYKDATMKQAMLPDLAALVWSACQHLVWPPMQHAIPIHSSSVRVQVIYMHQALERGASRVYMPALESLLRDLVGDGLQELSFQETWVSMAECDLCVTAYARSLKAYTGRAPGSTFKLETSNVLDSNELGTHLSAYRHGILAQAGEKAGVAGGRERVLPVFVYDLSTTDAVLLDGWRQAVAYKDIVMAVRTRAVFKDTYFTCNGHTLTDDLQNITRAVYAAVLQAGWAVADPALQWSPVTGKQWNYLWSVGNNPFSPLSALTSHSFAQADAAGRNLALTYINGTVSYAVGVLKGFMKLSTNGYIATALPKEMLSTYQQRLNMLHFKIGGALMALSDREYSTALRYARALMHDVVGLHSLARRVSKSLDVQLQCHESAHWRFFFLPVGAALLCCVVFIARAVRGESSPNKHDRRDHFM